MQRYQELDISLIEMNQRVAIAEADAKAKSIQEEMYLKEIKELTIELRKVKAELKEKTVLFSRKTEHSKFEKNIVSTNMTDKTREGLLEKQITMLKKQLNEQTTTIREEREKINGKEMEIQNLQVQLSEANLFKEMYENLQKDFSELQTSLSQQLDEKDKIISKLEEEYQSHYALSSSLKMELDHLQEQIKYMVKDGGEDAGLQRDVSISGSFGKDFDFTGVEKNFERVMT